MGNWTLASLSISMKLKLLIFHQKWEHAAITDYNLCLWSLPVIAYALLCNASTTIKKKNIKINNISIAFS